MENAHYFLHVTDTHLCFDAETPDTCCTEKSLRSLYQTAFAWDHRPAFVLITGDLVHEGTSADYPVGKTGEKTGVSPLKFAPKKPKKILDHVSPKQAR